MLQTEFNLIKDGSLVFHAQVCTVGGLGHFASFLKSEFFTTATINEISQEATASALKMRLANPSDIYRVFQKELYNFESL